jgi:hypothetical protein
LALLATCALAAGEVCLEQQLDNKWMFVDCDKPCATSQRCVSFPPLLQSNGKALDNDSKFGLQQALIVHMLEDYYSSGLLRGTQKIAVCAFSLAMGALLLLFVDKSMPVTSFVTNTSAALLILLGAYVAVFV